MSNNIRPLVYEALTHLLPARAPDTHKGDYGHVLLVGGDQGMGGAALMAAHAAARCGAGLVSVATHPIHAANFLAHRPELMVRGVVIPADLQVQATGSTVLVLGPGLGRSEWSRTFLNSALQHATDLQLPVVLDADALNAIAENESLLVPALHGLSIVTPHAGEAARLLHISREEVFANRHAAVCALQNLCGGVAILKGAGTLVCYQHAGRQQVETCNHGNPGMASGGMGDVLSGIIGGLLAQHLSLADSARLGVCIHSKAADMAARAGGERGMLASDLFVFIRQLVNP
jgi:ADP-dependent NAD(P)H-hydrate dehydratase / NAD(P)H-hydrate epimerase